MKRENSLPMISDSDDSLFTKIIRSLKSFLKFKQNKEEVGNNRTAQVLTAEKIERRIKKSIGQEELNRMEEKISKDISYIDVLNEDELNSLNDYYDNRIHELEKMLTDKKSKYFKAMQNKNMKAI